jgi:hypothetical protein
LPENLYSLSNTTHKLKNGILLLPLYGIILFACLYIVAAQFYPGGSQADVHTQGFSWLNNYWCNLLNEKAINGQHNPARPIAMVAMVILAPSLGFFWYIFPRQVGFKKGKKRIIQISGIAAMTTGMFLSTAFHDIVINVASLFGIVAMMGTFAGLYKLKWFKLFWFGIFNLLLIMLNNILYHGDGLMTYLPFVQKITFLFVLLWIGLINLGLYRKANEATD